ncbi:MAG: SagB/ThcOx family dehydrogenase [Candidatus Adiutrix sp.]|jgi:SagB-type dehydrogenase family enzyme|nr:SagB/ThcOx family dehydrogenase [Candidatus Adiutrix sp.]
MPYKLLFPALALALILAAPAAAAELATVKLPPPDFNAPGKTVIQALRDRKSDRVFAETPLSPKQLSEVLWAAGGINRPEIPEGGPGRTAPTSHNLQPLDIFAVTKEGVYKYDPKGHELQPVTAGDHRASAGVQAYVASAPLNIIYVANLNKLRGEDDPEKQSAANIDLGHMSENVYLYCASAGLNVIARTSIEPALLSTLLKLDENFLPLMGQTVGYPAAK